MFYLRGSAKDFYFVLVLLSAIFILVTCKRCSVNEVQNLDLEACRSFRGNFDSTQNVFDGHDGSELVSRLSVEQHSLENACSSSSSFCFPSTLTGFLVNEVDNESEASDAAGIQSEGLSSGLKQTRSNLSWSPHHDIFKLLDGRLISCSLYQRDVFPEFPFSEDDTKNGQGTYVSSCISPPLLKTSKGSESEENAETVTSRSFDGLSTPPVEIKPSLLDWGQKNMYYPSLAFLTVKNVDAHNDLSVYDPYSSNSQFYPCNFSEILLAPGEIASICLVFFPTQLGLSSAQLVLQTSFGGFLIQAKGFAVESPYLIYPLSGLDISSSGRWRKNFSLFNPFDEALYVEEVTAWISTSSGNTSRSSKSICSIHSMEDSGDYSMLSAKGWLDIERSEIGQAQIALRPHKNWEVGPQKTETIIELDISDHFEGKINAAFCLHLLNPSNNVIDTVMVPLEAELSSITAPDTGQVSVSLEALVPCNRNGTIVVALSVRNNSPYLLSVVKVSEVGESPEIFQIKSVEGLILFPGTITQVAIFNYAHTETAEVNKECKLLVLINDTRNSQIEIPCVDVINVCSGRRLDSSVGYTKGINNVEESPSEIKVKEAYASLPRISLGVDARESDEMVLRNWKSQATASFMSVLDENELLFPMVLIGNYSSQWISIKNPSQEPVLMQLILNSGEVIDNCRTPEIILQPSSTSIMVGNKSNGPTRYGFSIAKDAVTEAFVHPYGNATFGPIIFQPSNRCEWRSSALIRNNLSGVEWLSLRGFGGSYSLVLHERHNPLHSLELKLNMPNRLNLSTPSCYQPLTKDVYAKNSGDLPLEVKRIKVSGAECGLDGFIIHNCRGFSLQPGESVRLLISYQADFSVPTIQRDLELALATGILVIPMKASLPICMLSFCKRSMFWMRLKKAVFVMVFAASLLYLLVFFLLPFVSRDLIKSGKNSFSSVTRALDSLHMHFSLKNGFVGSVDGDEASLLESASRCSEGLAPEQGHVKPSKGHRKQINSAPLSRSSSAENFDMQDASDSRNLKVRVGKEKGRRRRKKKNGLLLFEVSSSQSGNSTPSSPLSPVASTTPKRPWSVSPAGIEQSVEAKNPFSRAPLKQSDKSKCSEPSSKVKFLDNKVTSKNGNSNWAEKPYLTRKVAGRAVLLPSATFPSTGRSGPPWTCHSPFLVSTSTIAPHARAPGKRLHSEKNSGVEEKMGVEEKYTYDIWGDHLFGLSSTNSKKVSRISSSSIESNSESFFVRGPQTLMLNSVLPSVSSNLEGNE
ncbi:hypothetical protein BUALT_Bualt04G0114300 [Buddleja alternifolia]|uniref:Transmembrane protein 131-like N-terminal domain-containing protein n=1 Tax=Buddleja alternifolia TaxID=168488 RepID=A0AAV6XUJ5_9LAMI|nr:hypothetical protein BUALT_Bualt04G0114300 [Buddleja alternifolia]